MWRYTICQQSSSIGPVPRRLVIPPALSASVCPGTAQTLASRLQSHVCAALKLGKGDALTQKALSVCVCGRPGGDDESGKIESAHDDIGLLDFWSDD